MQTDAHTVRQSDLPFLKNLSIIGAALRISQSGAGTISVDQKQMIR